MLERIEIQNYRSCNEAAIDLQPDLSVFIGPNGSGKTTLLTACLLLRKLADERHSSYREEEAATDECRIKATFRPDADKVILTADVKLYTDEGNTDVIVGSRQSWYAKGYTGSAKRVNVPMWFADYFREPHMLIRPSSMTRRYLMEFGDDLYLPEEFFPPLKSITRYVSDIKYYSASQFTNPSHCPVSFEIEQHGKRRRATRDRGHSRFLFDLYNEYKTRSDSSFDAFFSVVGPDGIGLIDSIEFKEIQTSSVDYRVRTGGRVRQQTREKVLVVPQFAIGKNQLSPSQLSEGTFKTITLLFYVMTDQSSALLIEEPEVCVHHGLLSSIVELIKTYSQKKQILMSTHSDFVLDQIEPRHVYRVSRSAKDGTKVDNIQRSLSADELTALKEYLHSEGNLGEYWRHGGLE